MDNIIHRHWTLFNWLHRSDYWDKKIWRNSKWYYRICSRSCVWTDHTWTPRNHYRVIWRGFFRRINNQSKTKKSSDKDCSWISCWVYQWIFIKKSPLGWFSFSTTSKYFGQTLSSVYILYVKPHRLKNSIKPQHYIYLMKF